MGLGYRLIRSAARLVLSLQMRLEITGIERLPQTGPVLFVSNHLGITDQLAIGARLPHELRILAKAEMFEWPILGWLARQSGVVPIRRGEADRAAMRTMRDLLRGGAWVLVFPEGTFVDPHEPLGMVPVKTGAAWLAWHTRRNGGAGGNHRDRDCLVARSRLASLAASACPRHLWRTLHAGVARACGAKGCLAERRR